MSITIEDAIKKKCPLDKKLCIMNECMKWEIDSEPTCKDCNKTGYCDCSSRRPSWIYKGKCTL